ncbi:MAG TPA: hypothetical protein VMM82_01110 [Spirochaetia bacterium]|nr:hypothetical protein [Spirochaetia bacterium]
MRLRRTLKIITWSAAGIALAILIGGKERGYPWIGIVILTAGFLHFLMETLVMMKRRRFRRRLADVRQYKDHRQFQVKDLEAALSEDAMEGVSVPVILTGSITGGPQRKAPLSNRDAVAFRVVAEPLEVMENVGGQVLPVESYWGELFLRDETGQVRLRGPGVLDGSSLRERVFTIKTLRDELPQIASRVKDGLGLEEGKSPARIELREIATFPEDKVIIYGKVRKTSDGLEVIGNDSVDDPDSLLVRAAQSPASSRLPRRTAVLIAVSAVTVCLLLALGAVTYTSVISGLFKPGGLLDASQTGPVKLDLDGRPLRVTIGKNHWMLEKGDVTRGFSLSADQADVLASRESTVVIQGVQPSARVIQNGDPDYPRWDGAAWILDAAPAASTPSPAAAGTTAPRSGRLYVRNLTGSAVKLRVMRSDGAPVIDTAWSFGAHEAAADPRGSYLLVQGKGPLTVAADQLLELVMADGSHRVLPIAAVTKWRETGSWLLDIVPEYLAGEGKLYVKNKGDAPVSIWVLGADGKPLFGEDPWRFEPQEGTREDKGLRLQYQEKDITISGRESIKVETDTLRPLFTGKLGKVGTWKNRAWTITVAGID